MSTDGKLCCKDCKFGKDVGYRQVLCEKTNEFQPELYSCSYAKGRKLPWELKATDSRK